MLSSALNNRIGSTMATIAVSQMLMDRINSLIKVNKYDVSSIGINSSLALTINLAQMVGMSYDEIVELITDFLTRNYGQAIKTLDKVVRAAMLVALDAMVSCANSPIIGDELLYEGIGDATNPMKISLSSVDIYNLFSRATPTGDRADYYYGDVPSGITPSMVWKSGDLDAFIWYAMNMVEPNSAGDAKYNEKMTWDNRNRAFKDYLDDEDLSQYPLGEMETYDGEDAREFWGIDEGSGEPFTFESPVLKRKKLFKIRYSDSSNSLVIHFNGETYGKKRIFGFDIEGPDGKQGEFNYERNRTIYDFNKDYIDNLHIFYVKPIVTAIINAAMNNTIMLSYGGTLSLEEEIIRGEISKILTKVIESDDTEIEDCYFTFSNDEYDALVHEAELRKRGITMKTGDTNIGVVYNPDEIMENLDQMTGTATLQEQKTIIKNSFTAIASVTGATDDNVLDTKLNWDGNSFTTNILQLLYNLIMQFIEAFLTPRVVLIFLINYKFANGDLPKSPLDFLSVFLKMLWPVIKALVDFFIEFFFGEVLERLKELMEIYILKISLEQLEKLKTIILALIENCTLNIYIPYLKKTQLIGNIDNVVGADIVETKSTPDKDNC